MSVSTPAPSRLQRPARLAGVSFVFLVALGLIYAWNPTTGLKHYQEHSHTEFILGQDHFAKREAALYKNGILRVSTQHHVPAKLGSDAPSALALFKKTCPEPDRAVFQDQKIPPSTALLPPASEPVPERATVISIVCDSDDLFHPEHGIIPHGTEKGLDWERRAWLSVRKHGETVLETPIGLRVHGGQSRKEPIKSFGLFFRKKYQGFAASPPGLFFGPDSPPAKKVILMNAAKSTRFMGAFATEIANVMGCKTSRLTPAIVYLNGTRIPAPYFLFEHQSPEFIENHFGIKDPELIRLKARNPRLDSYEKWAKWIRKADKPISFKEAYSRYDLEDLCAWALAISYTVTLDNNQGAYFRDKSRPENPWQSLTWDMDGCFNRVFSGGGSSHSKYFDDPFRLLRGNRAVLFNRLMEESPQFVEFYNTFTTDVLENKLTQEKLTKLLDEYVDLAKSHPSIPKDLMWTLDKTREFLSKRHAFYQTYLEQHRPLKRAD